MSATLHGVDPRTGEPGPELAESTADELDAAIAAAAQAARDPRLGDAARRAAMLHGAAARLRDRRDEIVAVAGSESGLPAVRLNGELERTAVQLEMLADVISAGEHLEVIIDPANPEVAPAPRPDVRRMQVPVGPVAVFGASNFPLAFSTAGGDTASALAAGCPVVVKGHPAHPRTGSLVAELLSAAVADAELPAGTFGHVLESGFGLAQSLVRDDRIEAVAFTGSLRGGRAIFDLAAARPRPIPVFAEMGSLNPVIVTEAALQARAADIADGLAASVTTFGGQVCTKPGIVLFPAGTAGEGFCELVGERLAATAQQVLLTKAIADGFAAGVAEVDAVPGVTRLGADGGADGDDDDDVFAGGAPTAHRTEAAALTAEALREEHFGPSVILVAYSDRDEVIDALSALGGQLGISIHSEDADAEWVQGVLPECVAQAGRIIFNGFSTGVAVCWAMMHGGPYPASSNAATTSVGMTAIGRFLRPVAFQNAPAALLPPALADDNPLGVPRRVDGVVS
ncbi:MAG TPA: aldehyde dehydrogenase (NADP(+)) [Solirubrobacteraceae bacterium]|nr:aldehyde dehydrogenase (NADP(+)) [Solirubrobacteraceae bacterium]